MVIRFFSSETWARNSLLFFLLIFVVSDSSMRAAETQAQTNRSDDTTKRSDDTTESKPVAPAVREMVEEYCTGCHNPVKKKGKLDLESILNSDASRHGATWELVLEMVREGEMPPEDKPQPNQQERAKGVASLQESLKAISSATDVETSLPAVVGSYCVSCHNADETQGGLNLDEIRNKPISQHASEWERVVRKVSGGQMPPVGKRRPSAELLAKTTGHLVASLDAEAKRNPVPGRTDTFRRLNRTEYQNAIRDLLALDVDAAAMLPADESSHGFDNITVGDLPPALLTRYINAAQKISRLAIGAPRKNPDGYTFRIPADETQEGHVPGLPLGTRGGTLLHHTFPRDGEYEIHVILTRDRNEHIEGLHQPNDMEFLVDRSTVAKFTVVPPKNNGRYHFDDDQLKTRVKVLAGPHHVGITFVKNKSSLLETKRQPLNAHFNSHRHPRLTPAVFQVSITGPFESTAEKRYSQGSIGNTPSRKRIFTTYPSKLSEEETSAKEIVSTLLRRAYRRSITEEDLERPMAFYRTAYAENGFEAGIELALSSILVSPRFLFRIERDPQGVKPKTVYAISDGELASRMAFFLWSSIPDDELLAVADRGDLRKPEVLKRQVMRMLADSRSNSLVTNFANQWLYLRNLDSRTPDARLFPDFDDNLRQAFRQETEMFFESMMREDLSVTKLLKADYTFLNERLAKHYGIPNVYGSRFRRVNLSKDSHRGGLLRQGSILTVTSYATRTSPVIRGNWVLENILGSPAPPPPDDVPSLEETIIGEELSVRERLAQHRANPACASCHDLMDPVGFGLENFDAVGRWRDREAGRPVDVAGGLPVGGKFVGVSGLENALLERPELFVGAMTEKLLTYALGRGIEEYDAPSVRQIVRESSAEEYRFSAVISGIISSPTFQMRTSQ